MFPNAITILSFFEKFLFPFQFTCSVAYKMNVSGRGNSNGYANTAGKEYLFYSKLVIEILKLNFKAVAVLLKDGSSAIHLQ